MVTVLDRILVGGIKDVYFNSSQGEVYQITEIDSRCPSMVRVQFLSLEGPSFRDYNDVLSERVATPEEIADSIKRKSLRLKPNI